MHLMRRHPHVTSGSWRLVVATAGVIALVGCSRASPAQPAAPASSDAPDTIQQASPTVAPTARSVIPTAAPATRTVASRNGPISETQLLNGRVAGVDELNLAFASNGVLHQVYVAQGQAVTQGMTLADTDSKQLQGDIDIASVKAQAAADSLNQAQQQATLLQQQAAERRAQGIHLVHAVRCRGLRGCF